MTNVKLVKFRFKPNSKQFWLDWSAELERRRQEVIATLKSEGVVSESCFISETGEELYYFMESEDLEKARVAASQSTHLIDVEHKEAKEKSLEFVAKLEPLFHFENRD